MYATHLTVHNLRALSCEHYKAATKWDQLSARLFLFLVTLVAAPVATELQEKQHFYFWIDFRWDMGYGQAVTLEVPIDGDEDAANKVP